MCLMCPLQVSMSKIIVAQTTAQNLDALTFRGQCRPSPHRCDLRIGGSRHSIVSHPRDRTPDLFHTCVLPRILACVHNSACNRVYTAKTVLCGDDENIIQVGEDQLSRLQAAAAWLSAQRVVPRRTARRSVGLPAPRLHPDQSHGQHLHHLPKGCRKGCFWNCLTNCRTAGETSKRTCNMATSTDQIESANSIDRNDCGIVVQLCQTLKHMGDALATNTVHGAYWRLHRPENHRPILTLRAIDARQIRQPQAQRKMRFLLTPNLDGIVNASPLRHFSW